MEKTARIQSLEAIRALAFIGVFLSHTGFWCFNALGHWGVSVFFILNGFVSVLSNYSKNLFKISFKNNINYAIQKIKGLYPLHLLTMLAMIIFCFVGEHKDSITQVLRIFVTNLLMIQEWFPFSVRSFNEVSWFFCPLLFSYLLFPFVINKMKTRYSKRSAYIAIIILYIVQIIVDYVSTKIQSPQYSKDMIITYDMIEYFAYRFPLTRFIDIAIGYNLGYIFIVNKNRKIKNINKKEIITCLFTVVCIIIATRFGPISVYKQEIPVVNYNGWWDKVLIFTPSSCLLIYLFAFEKGIISKSINNRITSYFARISATGFLIHHVVFTYLYSILYLLCGEEFCFYNRKYINVTLGLIITIICCEIWIYINKKVRDGIETGKNKPVINQ